MGGVVDAHRLQWSHAWLGAESGLAGACSGEALSPLWQMTENGSTAAAAACVADPPHKAVCRAIATIATMLRTSLKRIRMLSSDRGGGLPDHRRAVLR